jgi:cell division protein FtsZ
MVEMEPVRADELRPRIVVIGVGGAGGNAVANMIASDVAGVEFVVANTDAQALAAGYPFHPIQLGARLTEGLGAGSVAAIGRAAAEESIAAIDRVLDGAHMCFIAAGMGGGTGTGAAPVVARAARDKGVLTVGVVTKPFAFEGSRRARAAEAGIEELRQHVDTLIVIPNQNLFRIANSETTFKEAFRMADDVLRQGVRGITDLMVMPGLVNLDFADIRAVMAGMGQAMMGTGEASGDNRAIEASEMAISNPLLDGAIKGASGLLISIVGGEDMRLMEIDEAAHHIKELVDPEADMIWGSAINPEMTGRMRVSIVATGLAAGADATRAAALPPIALGAAASPSGPASAASAPAAQPIMPASTAAAPPSASFAAPALSARMPDQVPPAPGDLFASDLAPTSAITDAEEMLLLDSYTMRTVLVSDSRPDHGSASSSASDAPPPRAATLFERVTAVARGGASAATAGRGAPAPAMTEYPRVHDRRSPVRSPREREMAG